MVKKLGLGARLFLGLLMFVFGLNGFFHFIPLPEHPDAANAFLGALANTGYFFPMMKGTEVVAGAMLLSGYFAPLGLVLLAPIIVNIFFFHVFLAPGGMALPIVLVLLEAFLGFVVYKESFAAILSPKPALSE